MSDIADHQPKVQRGSAEARIQRRPTIVAIAFQTSCMMPPASEDFWKNCVSDVHSRVCEPCLDYLQLPMLVHHTSVRAIERDCIYLDDLH
jgi:hypothetical protein